MKTMFAAVAMLFLAVVFAVAQESIENDGETEDSYGSFGQEQEDLDVRDSEDAEDGIDILRRYYMSEKSRTIDDAEEAEESDARSDHGRSGYLARELGHRTYRKDDTESESERKYLGQLSANELDPDSVSNPLGAGSTFRSDGVRNRFGEYGNPFSSKSVSNPFATDAPKLYDSDGNYRGRLSSNRFDPDSVSNPLGRYGNPLSPDSINNPLGAGNRFSPDSPRNRLGRGLSIYDEE